MKLIASVILIVMTVFLVSIACINQTENVDKYVSLAEKNVKLYSPKHKDLVIVIDYTKSISEKRLYVIDLQKKRAVLVDYVSHSLFSGIFYANSLSGNSGSCKTIDGIFITQEKYIGRYGISMRIAGLNRKNSKTRNRAIVFHRMIAVPYSLGCFATPKHTNDYLANNLNSGRLIIAMH